MNLSRKLLSLFVIGALTLSAIPSQIQAQTKESHSQGKYVTPIESEEFWKRIEVQERIPKLIKFLENEFEGNFAGLYVDQENGGVINIGFLSIPSDDQLIEVSKTLGKDVKVKYNEVKYSRKSLESIVDELSSTIDETDDEIGSISSSFA
ncbi:hypothetical protein BRE01_11100 [Brevibacillus reuszeri]|uniref:Uncharacterized protein n=1 Tax=Brevibacillus reuszeri TaxID=54915 RepID=A0A0K9YSV8_9BACL|nr:hypothetical protein [Brevibacillus reuszeri]KNB71732.1 hypothetical protein ADS79_23555 [Brevibacillus reuszeri]MED1855443.1 hypothetical protein [Brevibacillus reuszeri]GED67408.1 hypothetical protein BRE01_11100 [Brevibacillus reuszeri]